MTELLLDAAGRRRSPATMPGFHAGRPPRNKDHRYPADPPSVEEIPAVMRTAGDGRHGCRLRGLIVVLWRAELRIHEALALNESDLDHRRGSLLVRRGKGGRRREVGMDEGPAAVDRPSPWPAGRPALLRHQRPDPRTTMVARRRARRPAPDRRDCRRAPALRARSAPARA
jgi:integrase